MNTTINNSNIENMNSIQPMLREFHINLKEK